MSRSFARPWIVGLAALALTTAGPTPTSAQPTAALPADLAIIHPDAIGFVHVRLADVWNHNAMAQIRGIIQKAGPEPIAALDDQFVPKPSTAERVTTVVIPPSPDDRRGEPDLIVALRFTEPFDHAKVVQSYCKKAKPAEAGGVKYFAEEFGPVAVYFPDDRTLVLGSRKTLGAYLTRAPKADGGLAPAIALAHTGKSPAVAAVNVAGIPQVSAIAEELPPDIRPLARTRLIVATMDLAEQVTLSVKMTYGTPGDATEAEGALKSAAQMARSALAMPKAEAEAMLAGRKPPGGPQPAPRTRPVQELPEALAAVAALGAIAYADEILADLPVTKAGSDLAMSVTLPAWTTQYVAGLSLSAGLALPGVHQMRISADRVKSVNNLKQIALGLHCCHDVYGAFPPAAITDKKTGKKLLSWRVAILPYIEQDTLYRQFKLDEPWDSPANLKAAETMPPIYIDPRISAAKGMTYYKVFTGNGTPFPDDGTGTKLFAMTDGTSNTIMVVSGGDPVNWAKPDDIPFDPAKPLPDLTQPFGDVIAAFCDGSVRVIKPTVSKDTLKALITTSGGEVIGYDDY